MLELSTRASLTRIWNFRRFQASKDQKIRKIYYFFKRMIKGGRLNQLIKWQKSTFLIRRTDSASDCEFSCSDRGLFRSKYTFFWSQIWYFRSKNDLFLTKVQYPVVLIFPDFWQTADLDGCTGSVCGLLSLFFSLSLENVFKQRKKVFQQKSSQNKLLPVIGQYTFLTQMKRS